MVGHGETKAGSCLFPVIAATIANMGICVMIFVSTLYLQQVRGYSGLVAGLMFIPAASRAN